MILRGFERNLGATEGTKNASMDIMVLKDS